MKKGDYVYVLGPKGSFSDLAFRSLELKNKIIYSPSFESILQRAEGGKLVFLPVKNSIIGEIKPVAKFILKSRLTIYKRIEYRVRFALLGKKKISTSDIHKVYCSDISFRQCRKFIRSHLGSAVVIQNNRPTSFSIKKIVQLKVAKNGLGKTTVAIGPSDAAKIYKLKIIADSIQDHKKDTTEFWLVNLELDKKKVGGSNRSSSTKK